MTEPTWVTARQANEALKYGDVRTVAALARDHGVRIKPHPKNRSWRLYHMGDLLKAFNGRKHPDREDVQVNESLLVENQRLKEQVKSFMKSREVPVHEFYKDTFRFGILSDPQYGSLYTNLGCIQAAYKTFRREKVSKVYMPGDIVDGEKMYKGQEYEIYAHGADAQVDEVINLHPHYKDIETHFITGNHDLAFWKNAGTDIGPKIAAWDGNGNKLGGPRDDMFYHGQEEADIWIGPKGNKTIKLRMSHPGGGTAYAVSYRPQKYIEQISGGQKPHIILFGHFHKAELMPSYRNICSIQCGTAQSQTPFMRRKPIAAHVGFWIVECTINQDNLLSRFKTEWFSIYEEQE
jgi:hypothetical protein